VFKEFKAFINRGNVLDLAVAVIVGSAFTGIVNSLVVDIITPILGIFLGGIDFTGLAISVGEAQIAYGNFIQAIINFLVISFVIFLIVRSVNEIQQRLITRKKEEEVRKEDSVTVQLLTEIRDLLKENRAS